MVRGAERRRQLNRISRQVAFAEDLADALDAPKPLREDALEFDIEVPVRTDIGHAGFEAAASHLLADRKGMRLTQEAVSALRAFFDSPYDVARALRNLGHEEWKREIASTRFGLLSRTSPTTDRSVI